MTALYPSTSAAQVFLPTLVRLSTTGAAAPITPDYSPTGTAADFAVVVKRPSGAALSFTLATLPAGVTGGIGDYLNFATSIYTTAGLYVVQCAYTADPDYQPSLTSFQWGGWVDTLMTLATETANDASMSKSALINRYDVNDPAAPTELTLYDDDGVTPLATRTIANADGSAVNPAQVLVLGALTP